jgi:hypothetical protein
VQTRLREQLKSFLFEEIKMLIERYQKCISVHGVSLYGCETSTLALREEHRLSVFQNRVLRIFGQKRDEMTGGLRKLHTEELHNLSFSKYN